MSGLLSHTADTLEDRCLLSAVVPGATDTVPALPPTTTTEDVGNGLVMERVRYDQADAAAFAPPLDPGVQTITAGDPNGLQFEFNAAAGMSQQAIDGFIDAADEWATYFDDQITIHVDIDFTTLDPGILGSAGSSTIGVTYANVRNALIADATSTDDTTSSGALSNGSSFSMLLSDPNTNAPFVDNNGSANNTTIDINRANARAIGLLPAADPTADASITFSDQFTWDFDRSDGLDSNAFDFVGVAMHEIGHAMGFVSGVDAIDFFSTAGPGGPLDVDPFRHVTPLDLFRHSGLSQGNSTDIDHRADTDFKAFAIDGGATPLFGFSTGVYNGDGQQASHWQDNAGIGLMDPTANPPGQLNDPLLADLTAFDVIGYDLNQGNPNPDPDDQFSEALNLTVFGDTTGSIDAADDVDMFSFFALGGETIVFDVDTFGSSLDGFLTLYDSAGNVLASNDDGNNNGVGAEDDPLDPLIEFTFLADDTYYLAVSEYLNIDFDPITGDGDSDFGTTSGGYTITTALGTPNPDPDDEIGEAGTLFFGDNFGAIDTADDVDMYEFFAAAGETYDFDVDTPGFDLDALLTLFDSAGNVLAANDDGDNAGPAPEDDTLDPFLKYTFTADGFYYLAISEWENDAFDPVTGDGDTAVGTTFGDYTINTQLGTAAPAEILGSQWEDSDGNGLFDPSELGLAGWTIFLDGNGNGTLDAGETSTVTASDGSYSFTGLAAGNYVVASELQAGYVQTAPTSPNFYSFTLSAGDVVTNVDFGAQLLDGTPELDIPTGPLAYTEGDPPTPFLDTVTLTDADTTNYSGGELLARSISGRQIGERYTVENVGPVTVTGSGLAGDAVLVNGAQIGTLTATGPLLRIDLDASVVTISDVEAVIEAISYRTVNQNPAVNKIGQIWVTDPDGNRLIVDRDIVVTPVNNNPVVGNVAATANYFEGTGPRKISGSFHIADGDYVGGGEIVVQGFDFTAGDRFVIVPGGPITTSGDPNDLQTGDEIFLNGTKIADLTRNDFTDGPDLIFALAAVTNRFEVREIVRAIGFEHTTNNPDPADRNVTVSFFDETGAGDSRSQRIIMRLADDGPELTLGATSGTVNAPGPARFFPQPTITDPDSPDIGDGRLVVGFASGRQTGDTLGMIDGSGNALTVGSTITVSGAVVGTLTGVGNTLRVSFSPTATFQQVRTIINRLTFENANAATADVSGVRGVQILVADRGNQFDLDIFNLTVNDSVNSSLPSAGPAAATDAVVAALHDDDWLN